MLPVLTGRRLLMLVVAVLAAAVIASPAFAQTTGQVKGKVTDEKGQPIEGAKITIASKDQGVNRTFTVTSKKNGDFVQIGIPPGQYSVTAEKEKIGAQSFDVRVRLGDPTEVTFRLTPGATVAGREQEKMASAVQAAFDAGVAASKANDYDTAIGKFQEAAGLLPTCHECYYCIGQAYAQKKDYAKAEEAFKKSIEIKADFADAYDALTTIYNTQKRFTEAAEASQKSAEISAAAAAAGGATGGGGSVSALYNQGVIAWNAGKAEDAKAKFEEALKVDPNHAASHYQLGMCLVNLGKFPDAVAEFETYLKLAPDGEYASQAKALIATLKK